MRLFAFLALWLAAAPALAHHPGARLDEVMAEKEAAFEATDTRDFPKLELATGSGDLSLEKLSDQIIVLSFVPEGCGDGCAAQQRKLGKLRQDLDATPMRDMVTFITVRPREGVPAEREAENWFIAPPLVDQAPELAEAFAALSDRNAGTPLVHLIDRGARHAAIFHGTEFERLNMLHYINGLTNAPPPAEGGLVDRLLDGFW